MTSPIVLGLVVIQPVSYETHMIMKISRVLQQTRSQYQNIEIVELTEYGRALVLDGLVQSTEVDEHIYHESLVHPAMTTHPEPKKVLIIGGGEGATLREVLKHSTVREAVMVDIDEKVVELSKQYLQELHKGSFYDPRGRVLIADGKEYVEKTQERYDVIILDLTDPYASEIAYELYTSQFYKKISNILTEDGIMVTQAGSSFYYENVYDKVLASVRDVFPIVREYNVWVPSFGYACNFIIGSKRHDPEKLTREEVDKRLKDRNVETRFYNGRTHIALMNLPIYRKARR
ncbi:MAG: polyamine aminopropyltransferase [Crenarchaeota archaeon]|nr:polyamine aminopropyltransferase [Thermoproteota archaeon]